MNRQNAAALAAARAAQESAKLGLAQIQMMKSRERARISISRPDGFGKICLAFLDGNHTSFDVENFGYTHALNVRAKGYGAVTRTSDPPKKEDLVDELDDINLPTVIRTSINPIKAYITFPTDVEENTIEVLAPNLFVHIFGRIDYEDVFGEEYFTTFRYVMRIDKMGSRDPHTGDAPIDSFSGWRKISPTPEDNYAT